MSLKQKLAEAREETATRVPPELLAIMRRADERLRRSGILDRVVKPGTKAPDSALQDQNGASWWYYQRC